MFYLVICIISFLVAYLAETSTSSQVKAICTKVILPAILAYVLGFGAMNGQDHDNYAAWYSMTYDSGFTFDIFKFGRFKESTEFGYALLMKVGHLLGLGVPGFLWTIFFIGSMLVVVEIFRHPHPSIGVILFMTSGVFFQGTNLVRQVLAAMIFIHALHYIEEKRVWPYVVSILIATTIHMSALFLLPVYLVSIIRSEKSLNITRCVLLGLWIVSIMSINGVIELDFLNYMSFFVTNSSYDNYLTTENSVGAREGINFVVSIVLNCLMPIVLLNRDKQNIIAIFCIALGVILSNFAEEIKNLSRFVIYFTITIPVYISTIFNQFAFPDKISKLIPKLWWGVVLYAIVYKAIFISLRGGNMLGDKFYSLNQFFQ